MLQAGDRAVPSEGRPRGGPPPEGQRSQPELQKPWWETDNLLRNHLGHSNYILYGQITLTVKWQLLSNLKIYIFSYSFFPARLQGRVLATSLLQAQHRCARALQFFLKGLTQSACLIDKNSCLLEIEKPPMNAFLKCHHAKYNPQVACWHRAEAC